MIILIQPKTPFIAALFLKIIRIINLIPILFSHCIKYLIVKYNHLIISLSIPHGQQGSIKKALVYRLEERQHQGRVLLLKETRKWWIWYSVSSSQKEYR